MENLKENNLGQKTIADFYSFINNGAGWHRGYAIAGSSTLIEEARDELGLSGNTLGNLTKKSYTTGQAPRNFYYWTEYIFEFNNEQITGIPVYENTLSYSNSFWEVKADSKRIVIKVRN